MELNKMRKEIADEFLAALNENIIPWERPWMAWQPVNISSGKEYHGVNRMWLSYVAQKNGYNDYRWCTFNQANENGFRIRRGEKGTKVELWAWYDIQTKAKLSYQEFLELSSKLTNAGEKWDERIKPISQVYLVFNAAQIEGVPEPERTAMPVREELLAGRDRLIESIKVNFTEGGNNAFYDINNDSIHIPEYGNFKSEYEYMATFLHEAGHASGAAHRLNRNIQNTFGTKEYAREELRVEISSAFTAQAIGIGGIQKLQNHKAYVQSWIEIIKNNPSELFAAIKEAEKISDYLIENGGFIMQKEAVQERQDTQIESLPDRGNPEYFKYFYVGEQTQEAFDYQKKTGWHMLWASDSHGMNGDTYIVYRNINDLPKFLRDYAAREEAREEKANPSQDMAAVIEKLAKKQKMPDREAERL